MNSSILRIELFKIRGRRNLFYALLTEGILLTVIVTVFANVHAVKDAVLEGLFLAHTAWAIISYSNLYFFIPVLIIVFTGQELKEGFVNRVVFLKGKQYFFISKIVYAVIIAFCFALFGALTLLISALTAPYPSLQLTISFFFKFFAQALLTNLCFSLFLTGLVFMIKSPIICFVVFFVLETAEKLIYIFTQGIHQIKLFFLPLHSLRLYYSRNGEGGMETYFMPFDEFSWSYIFPPLVLMVILIIAYWLFNKRDLSVISD